MGKLNGRLRIAVLERDGYKCVYCGRTSAQVPLHVDHVVPRARGGQDTSTNLVAACFDCNNGKRARLVALPDHVVIAPVVPRRNRLRRKDHGERIDERFAEYAALKLPCDNCGLPSDTVHFVPWCTPMRGVEQPEVRFACCYHDPGGYWMPLRDLFGGPIDYRYNDQSVRYTGIDHIQGKFEGHRALSALFGRLEARARES